MVINATEDMSPRRYAQMALVCSPLRHNQKSLKGEREMGGKDMKKMMMMVVVGMMITFHRMHAPLSPSL